MNESDKAEESSYIVPAVDKAFRILDILKAEDREMTISEIAHVTGWHKSSVHKLLVTLHNIGVVDRDEGSKRYSLGIALADYGRAALNRLDIRKIAKPFLQRLEESTGETAVLGVLQGSKMVMIDKKEPANPIRVSPAVGTQFPGTVTANGKVLLSWLPESRAEEIIREEGFPARTAKSITSLEVFRAEMAATRERGYAVDHEEFNVGTNAVAAPVLSAGQVVAVLSSAGPASRMTDKKMRECARKCIELAGELSSKLKARDLT